MSRLLEFFLGSILIAVLTVGLMFSVVLRYVLRVDSATDCAWHGSTRAWIDSNGDGLVNRGEPPLADVKIHVDDIENHLVPIGGTGWSATTDKDGDVQFNIPIPGCVNTTFAIYADLPEGYRLTTMPRLEARSDIWEGLGTTRVYYFGFVSDR